MTTLSLSRTIRRQRRHPLRRLLERLALRRRIRRDTVHVEGLPAHLLRDIGLHDRDIPEALRQGLPFRA